jgi:sn-glycerol 3-phosphate transport system substrate-binding protein
MRMIVMITTTLLAISWMYPAAATEPGSTSIRLRHTLSGRDADALTNLVSRFNQLNPASATVVLDSALTRHSETPPTDTPDLALMNVLEKSALAGPNARLMPLSKLSAMTGISLSSAAWYPQMIAAVGSTQGSARAVPLALSLPVLYYNRDMIARAGSGSFNPPATWTQMQGIADQLFDRGIACPIAVSHFSWIHLENAAAMSGEPSLDGTGRHLSINSLTNLKHLARMNSWIKSTFMHYFGPGAQGDIPFAKGQCALLTSAHANLNWIGANANFSVGVAPLPVEDGAYNAGAGPMLPDGASLWVLANRPVAHYRVAARFIAFMLDPKNQFDWVKATGYLPLTPSAMPALAQSPAPPFIASDANTLLSTQRKAIAAPLIAGHPDLRQLTAEALSAVIQGGTPVKTALDTVAQKGKLLLARSDYFAGERVAAAPRKKISAQKSGKAAVKTP